MRIDWKKILAVVGGLVILAGIVYLGLWSQNEARQNGVKSLVRDEVLTPEFTQKVSSSNLVEDLLSGDYSNLRVALSRGEKVPNEVVEVIKSKSSSKINIGGYDVFLFAPDEISGVSDTGWCGGDIGSQWWGGNYQMFSVKGDKILDFEDLGHLGFNEGRIFNGLHKYTIPQLKQDFILVFQYGVCGENDLDIYKLDINGNFRRVYFVNGDESGRVRASDSIPVGIGLENFNKISDLLCYGENCGDHKSYRYNFEGETFVKSVYPPKFVEPKLVDISNWRTYQNAKYGFEIKYPNDWEDSNGPDGTKGIYTGYNEEGLSIVFDQEKANCGHGVGCFFPGEIWVRAKEYPIDGPGQITYKDFSSYVEGVNLSPLPYLFVNGLRLIKTSWEDGCGAKWGCDEWDWDRNLTALIDFSPTVLIEISASGRQYVGFGYKNYVLSVVEEMLKTFKKTK